VSRAKLAASVACLALALAVPARADSPPPAPDYETVVTSTTPMHGSGVPRERVPANVQSVSGGALEAQHSLDLPDFMNAGVASVHVNEVQGNPLMPDLQYRGFLASPILGAPQGLSLYLDGVRLNEPFGDIVNWDLLPTEAIREVEIMPGSNPVYGLNTLGGSLTIETKNGFSDPGAAVRVAGGSFGRRLLGFGVGAHGERFAFYAAGRLFGEDGWRRFSPSDAKSGLVSASYARGAANAELLLLGADTSLVGNGPAPEELLALDRTAVFTYPDRTQNRMWMALARGGRPLASAVRLEGLAYFRQSRTLFSSGDQRDWMACQADATRLCSMNESGGEAPVVDATGAAVPFDPAYDAAVNASSTRQESAGATVQVVVRAPLAGRENHLAAGLVLGQGWIRFRAQSTVATFTDSREAVDTGLVDPLSPVAVDGVVRNLGVYATDTYSLRPDLFVTVAGRFDASWLSLDDRLGGPLGGEHAFYRFNPAGGVSWQPLPVFGLYGGVSESARAPTPVELTCASPTDPCRLPNGFVADPPLAQVVARTFEVGVRGSGRRGRTRVDYAVAAFRTTTDNDIQFVSSGAVANQGYFANVGRTQRQGLEAIVAGKQRLGAGASAVAWALRYTFLDATFEAPFVALSANHPDAVGGAIAVPAGAHIPGVPTHIGKVAASWSANFGLSVGADLLAESGQFLRGDEANLLPQLPGYVLIDVRATQRLARAMSLFLVISNVLDARPATFGVLGNASEVLGPGFASPRFVGPGAPRAAFAGIDLAL
jgi:outer membrane receptor protein involved in Fe transport